MDKFDGLLVRFLILVDFDAFDADGVEEVGDVGRVSGGDSGAWHLYAVSQGAVVDYGIDLEGYWPVEGPIVLPIVAFL